MGELTKPPSQNDASFDIGKLIREAFFDTDQQFPPPPKVLSFIDNSQEKVVLTLGNLSTIGGKAKSRKSSFANVILGALLGQGITLSKMLASLPNYKRGILYFDTEQTAHHLSRCTDRIKNIANIERFPSYFKVYRLRKFSATERLNIVRALIEQSNELGFVLIDGVRDLMSSGVNDETEATMIVSELMRLSEEKDIHIMLILHQNKGPASELRGHIGSELINKSETVFEIRKDVDDSLTSLVSCQYSRNAEFKSFAIDFKGETPALLDGYSDTRQSKNVKKSNSPYDYERSTHYNAVKGALNNPEGLSYSKAWEAIKLEFEKHNCFFGDNTMKKILTYYLKEGLVIKDANKKHFFNRDYKV
jgi:hypothetical protein